MSSILTPGAIALVAQRPGSSLLMSSVRVRILSGAQRMQHGSSGVAPVTSIASLLPGTNNREVPTNLGEAVAYATTATAH